MSEQQKGPEMETNELQSQQESVKVTKEDFEKFLATEEGRKFLQPKLDSYHSKGLATWKENHLSRLEEETRKKVQDELNPPKNEFEQKVVELEKKLAEKERQEQRLLATQDARKKLRYPELEDIVGLLVTDDSDTTNNNVSKINDLIESILQRERINYAKDSERTPSKSESYSDSNNPFSKENRNFTEMAKLISKDPEKAERLAKQAGYNLK